MRDYCISTETCQEWQRHTNLTNQTAPVIRVQWKYKTISSWCKRKRERIAIALQTQLIHKVIRNGLKHSERPTPSTWSLSAVDSRKLEGFVVWTWDVTPDSNNKWHHQWQNLGLERSRNTNRLPTTWSSFQFDWNGYSCQQNVNSFMDCLCLISSLFLRKQVQRFRCCTCTQTEPGFEPHRKQKCITKN